MPAEGGRRPPSLRAVAVGWLAQREYSVAEMRRKLRQRLRDRAASPAGPHAGIGAEDERAVSMAAADDVEAVIGWLLEQGYLDEGRFVASRVHQRSSAHGIARIAHELARHGLALPTDTAQALRATEFERADALWQRRFGEAPVNEREAARQARFLMGRGFSSEVVARVLREARRGATPPGGA